MKLKLTRKWIPVMRDSSVAECGSICLRCNPVPILLCRNNWRGKASMGEIERAGPRRRSITLARQDAERLAVELLRDIRDGTKAIMEQYGMGEDN